MELLQGFGYTKPLSNEKDNVKKGEEKDGSFRKLRTKESISVF